MLAYKRANPCWMIIGNSFANIGSGSKLESPSGEPQLNRVTSSVKSHFPMQHLQIASCHKPSRDSPTVALLGRGAFFGPCQLSSTELSVRPFGLGSSRSSKESHWLSEDTRHRLLDGWESLSSSLAPHLLGNI